MNFLTFYKFESSIRAQLSFAELTIQLELRVPLGFNSGEFIVKRLWIIL